MATSFPNLRLLLNYTVIFSYTQWLNDVVWGQCRTQESMKGITGRNAATRVVLPRSVIPHFSSYKCIRNTSKSHQSLVDTSESLFNLLGKRIKCTLDLLLARSIGVFKLHLRQLEDDVGGSVSNLNLSVSWFPQCGLVRTLEKVISLVSTTLVHASW